MLVTSPERAALDEAIFFAAELDRKGMHRCGLSVNRVHPLELDERDTAVTTVRLAPPLGARLAGEVARMHADVQLLARRDAAAVERLRGALPDADPITLTDRDLHDIGGLVDFDSELFGRGHFFDLRAPRRRTTEACCVNLRMRPLTPAPNVISTMRSSERGPTIVVGYDGSEASRAAIALAASRAGRRGHIIVVHAYDLPPDFLGSPNFDDLLSRRQAHGRSLLDALPLVGNDELLDTDYETELIGGAPAEAIANVARVRNADEIIVGARGLGRLRALLGSVSHELLHTADRPVVVIPSAAVHRDEGATRSAPEPASKRQSPPLRA